MAQDNLNAYAQWLVQNKDKKGTPEFDKVARAFQMLQAAGPRQAEAPVNPEGTGVGRAFQRGVIGTKQGIQAGIATNAANTLESMDVDRLTTIRRALGLVVPKDALAMMERDGTLQALGSVRNEDELNRWFDSLDRDFDLGPQNVAKLKAMVGGAEAAKSDYRAPGGKFETVRQTGQDALTRASELEADRAALPMSPTAQRGAQDFQDAEGVRDWARKSFKDPMAALAFIGETAAETGPAMAAGIGTSVVTGNPLLGAGIMIAASTPREYGGEVMSFLRDQDINVSDPQAIREAIDNGNIMAEAQKRGLTKAAIISAFEAIGMKGGGGILLQAGKQAFTGGAGEAASQVALDGEITSAKEVALEAVAELATTPGEAAILYTKNGTLKDPSSLSDTESQAAASLANRIRTIANQNGYNLKDVGNTGDAKQALEAAHEQISGQIKEIVANPAVKKYLNPKQAKTLDQLIDDYAAAQVAIRQGKNKVKSKVTQENFDAIMRLLPPTVEAQQIANLMREGNQLTDLFKNGTKGGISQFTDTFNPFTREDGSYDPSKVISGMANKGVAIATMGGSLPYQFSAVGAGRAIDAVTGRRSAVNRFVNKFENKETLPDPVGPSLIAAERLKKERDDARAAELGGLPQVDKDNSPIGTILSGTGLDRDGLKAAMTEIEAAFPDVKALEDVFGDIRKNLDGGTNRIRNLNDIIPVINQHLNTPDTTVQRAATPDQLLAQRGGVNIPNIDQTPAQNTPTPNVMSQAPQFGPQFTTQENYNRGIEANKAMNAELVEGVTTDPKLNRVQKGRLITSLDVLANNLGSDPVAAAQEQVQKLEEAGVPQEAIDAYVKPYVDRVVGQQARKDVNQPRMQLANPLFAMPLQIEGKPTVKKIGEAMNQDHLDKVGRQLFPEQSEEDYGMVRDYADQELAEQLKQPNSGVGWYSKDVDESMRLASKVFPTLATDPEHRQLYLTFAGIFSNGSDPDNAFIMSSWAFDDFLRTGQIPVNRAEGFYQQGLEPPKTTFKSTKTGKMVTKDAGWGIRNQANEQQLGMLKYLVETRGGLKPAMDFLLTPQKRTDINDVMLNSGLYKDGRFKTKKEKEGPDEYGFLAFGKKLGRYSLGLHGVDIEAGDTTIDLWYTRTFRRWTGRLLETPIGKEGVAAQPANDAERDAIFKLTGELATKYDLPVGDVQALLWFFEKRTWGAQGLNTKEGTNSSGARKLLRERGIDPAQDDDGAGSNGAGTQNSATPQQPRANIGVAGALANAIQGTNPRPSAGNTLPSDAEVKQQYAPTRAAFQVGKKGTDTENGIKDVDGVNRLAEAMGIHLKAYGAQRRMSKEMNPGGQMSVGLTGLYLPSTNTAAYLKPGVKRGDGSIVGENESFITALHELAHGIADKNADGSVSPHSTRMTNNLTDSTNVVRVGSFEYVIGEMLERPANERNEIRDEIIKLQDKMRYTFADGTSQATRDLVEVKQMYEQMASTRDEAFRRQWAPIIRNHTKYVRNVYEMAVDPLIWYLFDPKAFKKEAPKTAKLIRDYFNEAGKIQFYSHPLAMGVAVILAMLMKADQEDEQKKQMPPGALNQPMMPGALSA